MTFDTLHKWPKFEISKVYTIRLQKYRDSSVIVFDELLVSESVSAYQYQYCSIYSVSISISISIISISINKISVFTQFLLKLDLKLCLTLKGLAEKSLTIFILSNQCKSMRKNILQRFPLNE